MDYGPVTTKLSFLTHYMHSKEIKDPLGQKLCSNPEMVKLIVKKIE